MEDKNYNNISKNFNSKKSMLYSNIGIWTTLLIISTLALLLLKICPVDSFIGTSDRRTYISDMYSEISSSLYKNNNIYYNNEIKVIDYYIRSYKIGNYPFTEEFKEKFPNTVVVVYENGDWIKKDISEIENMEKHSNNIVEFSTDRTEKPKYYINYLSNKEYYNEFDPQKVSIFDSSDEKTYPINEVIVRGFYEDGKLNFTDIENIYEEDEKDVKNKNIKYSNYLMKTIEEVFNNIEDTSGIKKLNFAYGIDLNSEEFLALEREFHFREYTIPTMLLYILISGLIGTLIVILTKYKKAKEVGFYKGISKFPIEIVIILCGLWSASLGVGIDYLSSGFSNLHDNFILIIEFLYFIGILTELIAIYYLVFNIKSIYFDGNKSYILKNSIIVRIFSSIVNSIKSKSKNNINILDYKYPIIVYIVFIIFGYIATNMVVNHTFRFITFILWIVLVTLIAYFLKGYYLDLIKIAQGAKNIENGDYSYKLDDDNRFYKIVNSLNNVSSNLELAVENAVKSERLKSELIANVSHDLKTPLTSIINYSELLLKDDLKSEEIKNYSKIINEKSLKLKVLIEDLFEVSKITSNSIELELEEIDFGALINQIVGEWEDKLVSKNIEVILNLPAKKIILNLDGNKTSRVLDNLLSNIYKYTLENSRVYIDLYNVDKATLIIKNISKYPLNIKSSELIERFVRGDESRKTEGHGLGLSIASSLINAQGGKFDVYIDGDLFKVTIKF